MQWVHSAQGKLRHFVPRAHAQTNYDGSHCCLECGVDSCPILSHNLTFAAPSSTPRLAHPSK